MCKNFHDWLFGKKIIEKLLNCSLGLGSEYIHDSFYRHFKQNDRLSIELLLNLDGKQHMQL